MTSFTNPAIGPAATPVKVALPSALARGVPSIAAFIDLMLGRIVPPIVKGVAGGGERQPAAATGKSLPDKPEIDPAFAWLFATPPSTVPAPTPAPIALHFAPAPVMLTDQIIAAATPDAPVAAPSDMPPTVDPAAVKPPALPMPEIARPASQPVIAMPVVPPPLTPAPVVAALPALFALAAAQGRDRRDDETSPTAAAATILQPLEIAPRIAAAAEAQPQSLDLGRHDWPQKMIDHIEALRDTADAADTSIRLKPEALGRIDVALRSDTDGAVSVRFTADRPLTRMLIADAAPQLAAAAEARGIRLSGTSVDLAGSGMGDSRQRPPAEPRPVIANHRAAPRGDDSAAAGDGRIA